MSDWTIEQTLFALLISVVVAAAGIWSLLALVGYALATTKKPAQDGGSESPGWMERLAKEPVLVRTAILAILATAGSFGLPVSDFQQGAIVAAVLAILALFAKSTRAQVTPVEHPNMEVLEEAESTS